MGWRGEKEREGGKGRGRREKRYGIINTEKRWRGEGRGRGGREEKREGNEKRNKGRSQCPQMCFVKYCNGTKTYW